LAVQAGGAGPIGGVDSTTSIGGASWEVHKGSTGTWNVYSYVRTTNTTSATLNMMDFLKDLVNKGWMSSSHYLTSIEAGTEVFVVPEDSIPTTTTARNRPTDDVDPRSQ